MDPRQQEQAAVRYADPAQSTGYEVIQDPKHGYCRLNPIPPVSEISEFYESHYYDLARKGKRAPDLARLMQGGENAERERHWLQHSLYTDVVEVLAELAPGRRLLEVGCGTGDFLEFAQTRGFEVEGTEPSQEASQVARSKGLQVHAATFGQFIAAHSGAKFHAVVLLNVLEHVPDPVGMLQECRSVLHPGGIVCIRVPNDFTEIQAAAREKLGAKPWWIAAPDHINYFNFDSLRQVLKRNGFDTRYAQGDFPMEMFLLMGDNYVQNPEEGQRCHARRVQFDLAVPPQVRRKIYAALGAAGLGRNCLVFGKMV